MADHQSTLPFADGQRTPNSGVYAIRCIANRKVYIGSSADIAVRWKKHLLDLSRGKHHSVLLQRAWDKYGPHLFSFSVVAEVTDLNLLIETEQAHIDSTKACDPRHGYNICPVAGSVRGVKHSAEANARKALVNTGRKHTAESIERMRAAKTGLTHTPESRAKIGLASLGRVKSQETRRKLSAALKGKKKHPGHGAAVSRGLTGRIVSDETKAKLSASHMGFVTPDETKKKLSTANLGKHSKLSPADTKTIQSRLASGESGASLAREYGVSQSTISNIKHDRFQGYSL